MTRSFVLESLPDLTQLEKLWRGLDHTGAHSFFASWTWIGTLLRQMQTRPYLLKAMHGGELAGLALLTPVEGRLHGLLPVRQLWFNASGEASLDAVMIEHNAFAGGAVGWAALLRWFEHEAIADELVLPGIDPPQTPAGKLLVVEKHSHGWRTPLKGLGAEGIASAISSNARQQLRRSMRAYEGLTLDRAPDAATALEWFDAMKALHVKSWTRRGRQHAFHTPAFEAFHRALIAGGEGDVDLLRVRAGGRAIGYLYNFRRNGVVSAYQSGFDDEDPNRRPGYVCHAMAIAHYAQVGEGCYDFLAGANRLKQSFGLERYELCWRRYRKPTLSFRAEHAARKAVNLAKSIARRG